MGRNRRLDCCTSHCADRIVADHLLLHQEHKEASTGSGNEYRSESVLCESAVCAR